MDCCASGKPAEPAATSDGFQEGTRGNLNELKVKTFLYYDFGKQTQKGELGGPGWFVFLRLK